jgi:hypothetical protein
MRKRKLFLNNKFIAPLLTLLVLSTAPLSAFANGNISVLTNQSNTNGNLHNTWFNLEADSGGVAQGEITIKNHSNRKVRVRVFPLDGRTNSSGRFILKEDNNAQIQIGKWTLLESNYIELAGNQDKKLKFQVIIPPQTASGEYLGAIVAEEVTDPSENSSIKSRVGNRIYLRVPGQLESKINLKSLNYETKRKGFFAKDIVLNFEIENLGNTIARPRAELIFSDSFGTEVEHIARDLGEISPLNKATPSITWTHAPFFGRAGLVAKISNHDQVIIREVSFTMFPYEIFFVVFLVLVFGLIALVLSRNPDFLIEFPDQIKAKFIRKKSNYDKSQDQKTK